MFPSTISKIIKGEPAFAHCDAPCGVYDGASAAIAARAVVNLTKKILELKPPSDNDGVADRLAYHHTLARYTMIKEEQAEAAKREILILWTDYFKPDHLATFPDLHEFIWKLTKLCSTVKRSVDLKAAEELRRLVEELGRRHHETEHHA